MNKKGFLEVRAQVQELPSQTFQSINIVLFNLSILAMAIWLIGYNESLLLQGLGIVLLAFQFNHSYLIVHECTHDSFFVTRWLNTLCGLVFSLTAWVPYFTRKYEHLGHHSWTGSVHEPSTQHALNSFPIDNPEVIWLLNLMWKSWFPIFSLNVFVLLIPKTFSYKNKRRSRLAISSLIFNVVCLVSLFSFVDAKYAIHLATAFMLFQVLVEFFNLPHHMDSEVSASDSPAKLWNHDQHSKSFAPLPFFNKGVLLNFNYHVEHHMYPNLPWYHLDKVHKGVAKFEANEVQLPNEAKWHLINRKKHVTKVLESLLEVVEERRLAKGESA